MRISVIALVGFALGLVVGQNWKLGRIEHSINKMAEAVHSRAGSIESGGGKQVAAESEDTNVIDAPELRLAKEITPFLDPVMEKQSIPEMARAVAEVDGWVFRPDEEKGAASLMAKYLDRLEETILKQVDAMDAKALESDTGNAALDCFAQSSALMEMLPMSKDESKMQKLRDLIAKRNVVKQRIEQIRHLRYNRWAVGQIEAGFKHYHEKLNSVQKWADDDALTGSAIEALAPINPNLLDAPAMEIYLSLLRLTKEAVSEEHTIKLAKGLSDPATARKSELEF